MEEPKYASAAPSPQDRPRVVTVNINDNFYEPGAIAIWPGTTVVWVNNGNRVHTVTSTAGLWNDSGPLAPGEEFSVTFDLPGIFFYYSRPNTRDSMRGKIVVRNPRR
jgi:plastocyanin